MIASTRAHFREPGIQLMQSIYSDHIVDIAKFLQVLSESMHRFCQIGTLLLDLSSSFNDLLVKYLIAICKVSHSGAENHRILIHVNADLTFLCDKLLDRLAILGAFKDFIGFLELFQVFDLQEIDQANGRLKLFRATNRLEEPRELFLSLGQEFLRHFIRFQGKRRDQDVRELSSEDLA